PEIFIVLVALFTSAAVYHLTRWRHTLSAASIHLAIRSLMEWIGASTFFLLINLTLGFTAIMLIRSFTRRFVALYELQNLWIPVLSVAQGFIFQLLWRRDNN